jgi:hypothetical protein
MMISPVSLTTYTYPAAGASAAGQAVGAVNKVNGIIPVGPKDTSSIQRVRSSECQTCKNRKYMDQSGDANVSFKSPAHISPSSSYAAVSAHEQEHVSNAVSEGSKPGNQLISASVTLKMSVCPECGTPYIAGGVTNTVIKYDESNPYESSRKSLEEGLLKGMNFDAVA